MDNGKKHISSSNLALKTRRISGDDDDDDEAKTC